MTSHERHHLRQSAYSTLLIFVDPALWGFEPFTARQWQWTASLGYYPASFGDAYVSRAFAKSQALAGEAGMWIFSGERRTGLGIDLRLHAWRMTEDVSVSPRTFLWLQPKSGEGENRPGGLVGMRFDWSLQQGTTPFMDANAKTAGWVAGQPALESAASVAAGLTFLW